jgi:hypothetical protein
MSPYFEPEEDFVTTTASAVVRSLQRVSAPSGFTGGSYNMSSGMQSIFEYCSGESIPLQCISDQLQQEQVTMSSNANMWLLIFASALIFFMQAGFAMLCAGSVRIKNVGTFPTVTRKAQQFTPDSTHHIPSPRSS